MPIGCRSAKLLSQRAMPPVNAADGLANAVSVRAQQQRPVRFAQVSKTSCNSNVRFGQLVHQQQAGRPAPFSLRRSAH